MRITILWLLCAFLTSPASALEIIYSNPFFRLANNSTVADVGAERGRFEFQQLLESEEGPLASDVSNDSVSISTHVDWFSISTEAFADTTGLEELALTSLTAESLGRFEVDLRVDTPEPLFLLELASTLAFDREIIGPERDRFPIFGPGLIAHIGTTRLRLTSSSGYRVPIGSPGTTTLIPLAADETYRLEMVINSVVGGKEVSGTAFQSSTLGVSLQALPIPEPGSTTLVGLGLIALVARRRCF